MNAAEFNEWVNQTRVSALLCRSQSTLVSQLKFIIIPSLLRRDSRTHDSRRMSQFSQRFTHSAAKATVVVDQHSRHKSQLSIVRRMEADSFIRRCIKRRIMIDFRQRGSLNGHSIPPNILHVSSFPTFASVKNEMQTSVLPSK